MNARRSRVQHFLVRGGEGRGGCVPSSPRASSCKTFIKDPHYEKSCLCLCLSGVIYHPDDEALAQMLKDRVRYINKTLSHDTSYPSNMPSIEVIPIRTTSSKKLLSYGKSSVTICFVFRQFVNQSDRYS